MTCTYAADCQKKKNRPDARHCALVLAFDLPLSSYRFLFALFTCRTFRILAEKVVVTVRSLGVHFPTHAYPPCSAIILFSPPRTPCVAICFLPPAVRLCVLSASAAFSDVCSARWKRLPHKTALLREGQRALSFRAYASQPQRTCSCSRASCCYIKCENSR